MTRRERRYLVSSDTAKTHSTKSGKGLEDGLHDVKQTAQQAQETAREATENKWFKRLARVGYATKGVVYLLVGGLAVTLAIGHGGEVTDQKGALDVIFKWPFGRVLLALIAIGLLAFGLWSIVQAIFDKEHEGSKAKGIIARIGYGVVGLAYLILAFGAYKLVSGAEDYEKSTTTMAQDWTGRLLHFPFGVAIVTFIGVVILGVAIYLFARAWTAKFQRRFHLGKLSDRMRKAVIFLGRFGYAALGIVFTIIGIFLIVAALKHNPQDAKGLDAALKELLQQPFGPVLLGLVALGLVAYGVYSFAEARYRYVE
jgi:hypothetical protein